MIISQQWKYYLLTECILIYRHTSDASILIIAQECHHVATLKKSFLKTTSRILNDDNVCVTAKTSKARDMFEKKKVNCCHSDRY